MRAGRCRVKEEVEHVEHVMICTKCHGALGLDGIKSDKGRVKAQVDDDESSKEYQP